MIDGTDQAAAFARGRALPPMDGITGFDRPLCAIREGEAQAATHWLRSPVAAYRIVSASELHRGIITVVRDGETIFAHVPDGFARLSTPVPADWLIVGPDGSFSHRTAASFAAESDPVPPRPRHPRAPHLLG